MIGPITPAILVILLRPYGYEVTLRCLTDWRQKGYLPRLERIGRGWRNGILRYWKQKDILKQALEVCRRLRDRGRKRAYGVLHKNWLSGAEISVSRAKQSWIRCSKRISRFPKALIRSAATELSAEMPLNADMIADVLNELGRIIFRPNHAVGKALDVAHIHRLVQRVITKLCEHGKIIVIDEKPLADLLRWLNTYFSPAAIQSLVASTSSAELRHARDSYLDWWRKADAIWTAFMAIGNVENSSLMPLAHALAPLFVPLLLSTRWQEARLEGLQPV
jgi:hypothetical protein